MLRTAAALLVLGALPFGPAEARAQDIDLSAGYGAGYIQFASFAESGDVDLGLESGWTAVWHADRWFGRWAGIRAAGLYTRRPLEFPAATRDIDVWSVEGDLLLRLVPAAEGRSVMPYLLAGGGSIWYRLGEGPTVRLAGTDVIYDRDEQRQWLVSVGGGLDIYPGWTWRDNQLGLRLEVADHVVLSSPFRVSGAGDPDPSHNIRATVSIQSGAAWISF